MWAQLLPKLSAPASRTRPPTPQRPSHTMQAKSWDTVSAAAHHLISQTIVQVLVPSRDKQTVARAHHGACGTAQGPTRAGLSHAGEWPRLGRTLWGLMT